MNLIVQYYRVNDSARQLEIDECLTTNLENKHITKIHVITEDELNLSELLPFHWDLVEQKVVCHNLGRRMTWRDSFNYINKFVPGGVHCAVANADICFDDSLGLIEGQSGIKDNSVVRKDVRDLTGQVFALLRYNKKQNGTIELFGLDTTDPMYDPNVIRGASQDAWIFRTPLPPIHETCDFYVGGVHLCDSKINWVFAQAGLRVSNPCLDIRIIHIHSSAQRQRAIDTLSPPFVCPVPCLLDPHPPKVRNPHSASVMHKPFNGDDVVGAEVKRLLEKYKVKTIVETGTFHGYTTKFLAEQSEDISVHTIEIRDQNQAIAKETASLPNVTFHLGHSPSVLRDLLPTLSTEGNILFYLDAHWGDDWPLLAELDLALEHCNGRAIVVIDDFQVPNRPFKYDSYKNQPCNIDFVRDHIGDMRWYYHNSTTHWLRSGKLYALSPNLWDDTDVIEEDGVFYARNDRLTSDCAPPS